MPLTKEQLLLERVRVISDYPDSIYKIGDVIVYSREVAQSYDEWHNVRTGEKFFENPGFFKKYPNIFQPLPWWSDRQASEMPEYLEDERVGVLKVIWEDNPLSFKVDGEIHGWIANERIMPFYNIATEEEYQEYINQKQQ